MRRSSDLFSRTLTPCAALSLLPFLLSAELQYLNCTVPRRLLSFYFLFLSCTPPSFTFSFPFLQERTSREKSSFNGNLVLFPSDNLTLPLAQGHPHGICLPSRHWKPGRVTPYTPGPSVFKSRAKLPIRRNHFGRSKPSLRVNLVLVSGPPWFPFSPIKGPDRWGSRRTLLSPGLPSFHNAINSSWFAP